MKTYYLRVLGAAPATPENDVYYLTREGNRWTTGAIDLYDNNCYTNYSATKSSYGLPLQSTTWIGLTKEPEGRFLTKSEIENPPSDFETDSGFVRSGRFVDTSAPVDVVSFNIIGGDKAAKLYVEYTEEPDAATPTWVTTGPFTQADQIDLIDSARHIRLVFEPSPSALTLASLEAYIRVEIDRPSMAPLYRSTRGLADQFPEWMAIHQVPEEAATPETATPNSVGTSLLNALTGEWLDDIERKLRWEDFQRYIDTVDLEQMAWAYETENLPEFIFSVTGDGRELTRSYDFNEFLDSEGEDVVYIDEEEDLLYTAKVYIELDINGVEYLQTPYHVWNYLDEIGLYVDLERIFLEDNDTYQKRIKDVFANRGGVGVESLKLALRRELNIWATEGATPSSDYEGATPEVLEIEDLEKDPKYWSEDGMPTPAFIELVNDLSWRFPTTWGRFIWDQALWDTAGKEYKGHRLLPYRMDGATPSDVQSGVGDGDDLFVFRPDVITGPRDFQATLKLRGRERTAVEEYVPLHLNCTIQGVGDKTIYDNPVNTSWFTVEVVSGGLRYFHFFELSATSDIDHDTPASTPASYSQYRVFDDVSGTTRDDITWVDINNTAISTPIAISSITNTYLRPGKWVPNGLTLVKNVAGGSNYEAWLSDDPAEIVDAEGEIATAPANTYVEVIMKSSLTATTAGTWESEEFPYNITIHGVEPYNEPAPLTLDVPEIIWDPYATNRQIELQIETINPMDAASSERGGIAYDDEDNTIFVPAEVIYVNDDNSWDSQGTKYFDDSVDTLVFDTGLVAWGSGAGSAATPQPDNAPMLMNLSGWGSKKGLWVTEHQDNRVDIADVNLLDANTAHLHQSKGTWEGTHSNEEFLYGNGSLKITAQAFHNTGHIPATAGQEYTFGGSFRSPDGASPSLTLVFRDSGGITLAQEDVGFGGLPADAWVTKFKTVIAPANSVDMRLRINPGLTTPDPDATVLYGDRFTVREGATQEFVPSTRIVGDLDVRYRIAPDVWDDHRALGKYRVGGEHGWLAQVFNGRPSLVWSVDGTNDNTATADATPTAEGRQPLAFRSTLDVDNGAAGYDVEHFTATDDDLSVATWQKLGSTITGGATTSIFNTGEAISVGEIIGSASYLWDGGFLALEVRDGKDGPVVLSLDFSKWQEGQSSTVTDEGYTATLVTSGANDIARIIHINSAMVTDTLEYFELEADESLDQDTAVIYIDGVKVADSTPWNVADWTHGAPTPGDYTWIAIFDSDRTVAQDSELTSWSGAFSEEPSWLRRDAVFYWNADDTDAAEQYSLYNDVVNLANYAYPISTYIWSPFEALHNTPYNGVVDENGPWRNGVPPSPGNSNFSLTTYDQLTRDDFGIENSDEIVITWMGVENDNSRVITWLDSNTVKPSQNDEEEYPETAVEETVVNGVYVYEPVVVRARIKPGPDKQWSPQVHSGYFYDQEDEYYLYAKEGVVTTAQQEVVIPEVVRQGAPVIAHTDEATPQYLRQVAFFDEDSATPSLSLVNTEEVTGTGTPRLYVSWSDLFDVTIFDEDNDVVNVVTTADNVITTDITTSKDETYYVSYKVRNSFYVDNDHVEGGEPRSRVYFSEPPLTNYIVYYEASDFDPATPVDLALNPLYTSINEGFVYLSHNEYTLDSIRAYISPSKILADNEDYLMLTLDSLDEYGNPKPNKTFQLEAEGGTFDTNSITTGEDGTAIAILTSAEHPKDYAEAYWEAHDGMRGGWLRDLASEHDGAFGGNATAYLMPPKGNSPGYLRLPGDPGQYVEVDSNTDVDSISGETDFRIGLAPDKWASGSEQTFVAKWGATTSFRFGLDENGRILFARSGSKPVKTFDPVSFLDGEQTFIRKTRNPSNGVVRFFVGPTIVGPWTQIGPDRLGAAGTIANTGANVEIGAYNGGTSALFAGRIYQVQLIHEGDTVLDVNFSNKPAGSKVFKSTAINNVSMDCTVHAPEPDTTGHPRVITHDEDDFLYLPGLPDNYAHLADTNILDANTAHIEQGVGAWTVAAGSTALSQDNSISLFGNYSLKPTLDNNSSAIAMVSEGDIGVNPSTAYSFSVWVYTNALAREAQVVATDYAGATPSSSGSTNGAWASLTVGDWTQVSVTHTTAADATNLRLTVHYRNTDTTAPPAGESVWLDRAVLRTGNDASFIPSTNLVGTAEIELDIAPDTWTPHPGEEPYVVNKVDSWALAINTGGSLTWLMGTDEISGGSSGGGPLGTVTLGLEAVGSGGGEALTAEGAVDRRLVKTHRDSTTGEYYVYQFDGETWNQIGSGLTTPGNLNVNNAIIELGSDLAGTERNFLGNLYSIEIRDGRDGPVVASIQPSLSEEPYTSIPSDEGHTVTIERAAGGYKSAIVTHSILMFDGVNDFVEIADHVDLDFDSSEDVTALVVFRMYDTSTGSSQVFMAKKSALDNSTGWAIYTNASDATARVMFDSTANQHNPTDPITPGELTMLGFTREIGVDVVTYMNNVYESHGVDDADFTNDVSLRLGAQGNGGNFLAAEMLSAAIIPRVMSGEEIEQAFRFMKGEVTGGIITISGDINATIPFELEEPIDPRPNIYASVRSERIQADGVSQNIIYGRVENIEYQPIAGASVQWKKARSIYELFNGLEVDSGSVTTNEEGAFVVGPLTVAEQSEAGYWFVAMETSVGEHTIGEVVFWYEYPESVMGIENVSGLPQQPVQMKTPPGAFPDMQTGVPTTYEYDETKDMKFIAYKKNWSPPDWYKLVPLGHYERWWEGPK